MSPTFTPVTTRVSFSIEVPEDLLLWIDSDSRGGCKRQFKTPFDKLDAIEGIQDVEFNGHFGPYIYYTCDVEDADKIHPKVISLLRYFYRQMMRGKKPQEQV